jgi:hypothetical protein
MDQIDHECMGNCILTTEAQRHGGFIVFEIPGEPPNSTLRNFKVIKRF